MGGSIARGAAFALCLSQRIRAALTDLIGVARASIAPRTPQSTQAAAHESAKQILMGLVVPAGHLDISIQPNLHRGEGLQGDDGPAPTRPSTPPLGWVECLGQNWGV
jgi:hypothetical protein